MDAYSSLPGVTVPALTYVASKGHAMDPPVLLTDRPCLLLLVVLLVLLQVSFVNSICTSKGGTHVNYVVDQITKWVLVVVWVCVRRAVYRGGAGGGAASCCCCCSCLCGRHQQATLCETLCCLLAPPSLTYLSHVTTVKYCV